MMEPDGFNSLKTGNKKIPRVEFVDVTKCYGDLTAVDRLNLTLFPGEIFAFLGLNGAGKTTTIKLLVGLLYPTAGQILVNGIPLIRSPEKVKQMMGYIPDVSFLYEKLTGAEFLDFVGALYGLPRADYVPRRNELLETFGLAPVANRLIEEYSHGMRQRLIYASVFLHDPELMVIDEPTVGLDPEGMKLVKTLLRQMVTAGGTVLLSTHVLSLAETIADRIGIIHQGQLLTCGTLSELIGSKPSCRNLEECFLHFVGSSR